MATVMFEKGEPIRVIRSLPDDLENNTRSCLTVTRGKLPIQAMRKYITTLLKERSKYYNRCQTQKLLEKGMGNQAEIQAEVYAESQKFYQESFLYRTYDAIMVKTKTEFDKTCDIRPSDPFWRTLQLI